MSNPDAELLIKTKVSKKDNVELIDYLSIDKINSFHTYFRVNNSGVLRKQNKTIFFQPGINLPKTEMDLVKIQRNNNSGRYLINCGTWSKNLEELVDQQGVFMVFRGLTLKDLNRVRTNRIYKLSQGDIIKLGRMYLKVLEINIKKEPISPKYSRNNCFRNTILESSLSSNAIINQKQIIRGFYSPRMSNKKNSQILFNFSNSILTSKDNKRKNNASIDLFTKRKIFPFLPRINSPNELFLLKKISKRSKERKRSQDLGDIILNKLNNKNKIKPVCRICYGEDSNDENPLISPCICKGSTKYIHYLCLKNWLNAKIEEEKSEDSTQTMSDCITYNRKEISCELCKEQFPDYIIHNNIYYNILFYKPKFEEFIVFESMKSSIVKNRYIHVVSLDNKDYICIGRASECDLSLSELSVSRNHCLIHREKDKVFLEDNSSKFGTLVLVQNKNMIVNDFMSLKIQANKTFIKFKLDIPFSFSFCLCGKNDTVERLDYQAQNKKSFDVMSCFVIKEDNDNKNNYLYSKDDEEENNSNNNKIIKDNKNNHKTDDLRSDDKKENENNKEKEIEKQLNSINDKEGENIIDIKNNINDDIKSAQEKKCKESLIDKSNEDIDKKSELSNNNKNTNNKNYNNLIDNDNGNDKEEIKEEIKKEIKEEIKEKEIKEEIKEKEIKEKEIKDEIKEEIKEKEIKDNILNDQLSNNNKNDQFINNKSISTIINNLHNNRFKIIDIKKGRNDKLQLPKFDKINLSNIKENISLSLLADKNNIFNKNQNNEDKNFANKVKIRLNRNCFINNNNKSIGNGKSSFSQLSSDIINNFNNNK